MSTMPDTDMEKFNRDHIAVVWQTIRSEMAKAKAECDRARQLIARIDGVLQERKP